MRAGSYMIVPPAPMRVNISVVCSETSWSMSRSPETMTVSMPWLLRLETERADEVVRLVAVQVEDRDAERGERLAHDGELVPQVVRGRAAGRPCRRRASSVLPE